MLLDRACHCARVASLLRPAVASSFSSSTLAARDAYNDLLGVVREEAVKQDRQRASLPNIHLRKALRWERFPSNKTLVPKDLTYNVRVKTPRWLKRVTPTSREACHKDPFYLLDLDPRDFSKNAPLLYGFVSEMGKIHGRDVTNLTARSQRLLGKTIRRAKQMGIMANLSRPIKVGNLQ